MIVVAVFAWSTKLVSKDFTPSDEAPNRCDPAGVPKELVYSPAAKPLGLKLLASFVNVTLPGIAEALANLTAACGAGCWPNTKLTQNQVLTRPSLMLLKRILRFICCRN